MNNRYLKLLLAYGVMVVIAGAVRSIFPETREAVTLIECGLALVIGFLIFRQIFRGFGERMEYIRARERQALEQLEEARRERRNEQQRQRRAEKRAVKMAAIKHPKVLREPKSRWDRLLDDEVLPEKRRRKDPPIKH